MKNRPLKSGKKIYRSTFTYFIPSPPLRKNGYREVEFDKIMRGIFDSGFELESFNTQAAANGIFIIVVLKTLNKKIYQSDFKLDVHEKFQLSHAHPSEDIFLEDDSNE